MTLHATFIFDHPEHGACDADVRGQRLDESGDWNLIEVRFGESEPWQHAEDTEYEDEARAALWERLEYVESMEARV